MCWQAIQEYQPDYSLPSQGGHAVCEVWFIMMASPALSWRTPGVQISLMEATSKWDSMWCAILDSTSSCSMSSSVFKTYSRKTFGGLKKRRSVFERWRLKCLSRLIETDERCSVLIFWVSNHVQTAPVQSAHVCLTHFKRANILREGKEDLQHHRPKPTGFGQSRAMIEKAIWRIPMFTKS